ncbi:phage major capsid protein [Prescottella agglutinans]|nr:phage major capsid protein [Prescottella agglutinans]
MRTKSDIQRDCAALAREVTETMKRKDLRTEQKSAFLDKATVRNDELHSELKNLEIANRFRAGNDLTVPVGAKHVVSGPEGQVSWSGRLGVKNFAAAASPLHAGDEVWRELHDAAVHRKEFRAEIGTKAGGPTAIGGLNGGAGLPPLMMPGMTQTLPYEPDRLFEHFPGTAMPGPSVEYVVHGGNANTAAVVAEGTAKPDIGMQLTTATVKATKIAALASITMEAAEDFESFLNFVPLELTRAVIDVETDQIVNGTGANNGITGLLHVPGTLARAFPAMPATGETALDTLELAVNDLREGPAFATCDLFAMHPGTFSHLRRIKDTLGRFLLQGDVTEPGKHTIWGIPVVVNTKIPAGTVVAMDTTQAVLSWTRMGMTLETNRYGDAEWTNNLISFRAEERIAIGVQRPAAVCVVTGIGADTSATP